MKRAWIPGLLLAGLILGDASARSVFNTWQATTLDAVADVGYFSSLAFSPGGGMAIAYYDAANGNLKCIRGGAGIYLKQTVDSIGDVGAYCSIAYAGDGTLGIAYYDATNGNLKYADLVSGVWNPRTVYSTGNTGYTPSLAFTADNRPAISFYDATNGDLLYAEFEASAFMVWDISIVDSTGDVGYHSSLAFYVSGAPAISYYDITNKDLKYAIRSGNTWARHTPDSAGDVGQLTSLAFSPAGVAYIAYYDNTNLGLKLATVGSGLVTTQIVDSNGAYPSIAFTPDGRPAISYYDFRRGTIKYAVHNGLLWVFRAVVPVDGGTYSSLAFTAAGLPAISYYASQSLRYVVAKATRPAATDFDGDGISDLGLYHPVKGKWHFLPSSGWQGENQFGYKGTLPVTGDFDGDGFTDYGCYDPVGIPGLAAPGSWYLMQSKKGFRTETFGYKGTLPVVGDFDGDGIDDFGCYDPAGIPGHAAPGSWYLMQSKKGFRTATFGYKGTLPVVGDFDGDGIDDFGCYDPVGIPGHAAPGSWYIMQSKKGFRTATFGYKGTVPVVGDYDGDDIDDFGCYDAVGIPGHAAAGSWYIMQSKKGFRTETFGYAGTLPLGR